MECYIKPIVTRFVYSVTSVHCICKTNRFSSVKGKYYKRKPMKVTLVTHFSWRFPTRERFSPADRVQSGFFFALQPSK